MLASSRACPLSQVTAQMLTTVLYLDCPQNLKACALRLLSRFAQLRHSDGGT